MRSANLSVKQLRAFIALAELRNFTKAAAACHLSQPAFSLLIQAVEQEVGAKLFERDTRKVELTAAGGPLLEALRPLVRDFDEAIQKARQAAAVEGHRVAIAVLPSVAARLLPLVLPEFQKIYPDANIRILDLPSDACLELVRSGEADIGVISENPRDPQLTCHTLLEEPYYIVCSKNHPLASSEAVRMTDLLPYQLIHLANNAIVAQLLKKHSDSSRRISTVEVESLQTARSMTEAGLGLTICAETALGQVGSPLLSAIPLNEASLLRHLYLIHRKAEGNAMRSALVALSLERMRTTAPP
ncbi:MAG: LysR family transcriptional regulator [Comamonadaceae bacterium]|nr:LysR family transcriptional regulator [Comamonadaceae bacterium]